LPPFVAAAGDGLIELVNAAQVFFESLVFVPLAAVALPLAFPAQGEKGK
jgi:hypothetical protein